MESILMLIGTIDGELALFAFKQIAPLEKFNLFDYI